MAAAGFQEEACHASKRACLPACLLCRDNPDYARNPYGLIRRINTTIDTTLGHVDTLLDKVRVLLCPACACLYLSRSCVRANSHRATDRAVLQMQAGRDQLFGVYSEVKGYICCSVPDMFAPMWTGLTMAGGSAGACQVELRS